MNKNILFGIGSSLCIVLGLWWASQPGTVPSKELVTTVFDKTSPDIQGGPSARAVVKLYGFNTGAKTGAEFRCLTITDSDLTPSQEAHLGSIIEQGNNMIYRKDSVDAFISDVTRIIANTKKLPIGRNHSSVYAIIANEANLLATKEASKRTLIVNSDLMEHTSEMNFYNEDTLSTLEHTPEKIQLYLQSIMPLKNLKGVEVYIVYQPKYEENRAFRIISRFYLKMLTEKGAVVHIVANI